MVARRPAQKRTAVPWHSTLGWAALFLVCAGLFGSTVHDELGDLGGDSAQYVLLAQSLASGQGYRDLTDSAQRPHVKYPPLFPAMLAPIVQAYGPLTFRPMHALVAAWAVAAILLAVLLLHTLGSGRGAWVAGWATAAHPAVLTALLCVWTEFPYLALSLLALYALHRCHREGATARRWYAASIIAVAAATMTRTIGVALILAGACALLPPRAAWRTRRTWQSWLLWLVLASLPLALWSVRNALAPDPSGEAYGYWRQALLMDPLHQELGRVTWPALTQRIGSSAAWSLDGLGGLLGGVWPVWLRRTLVALTAWGWVVAWRHRRGVIEWYALWYLLFLLPHPFYEERFLLPLLPLAWRYLWMGGRWCVERWRRLPALRIAAVGGLALTLLGQGLAAASALALQRQDLRLPPPAVLTREPDRYSIQWAHMDMASGFRAQPALFVAMTDYLALLHWMRHHVTERSVVLARKPPLVTLFGRQPSVYFPFNDDPAAWRAAMAHDRPVLLVADQWTTHSVRHAWPMIAAHPDWFAPVHTVGTATLFRVTWPHHLRGRPEGD